MKCESCGTVGNTRDFFKKREFHSLGRTYYVCRRCGKANRATAQDLDPASREFKKAVSVAKEMRGRFLESLAGYRFKILVWGPSEKNVEKAEVFAKRKQIRDALRERGQEAFFSEELPITDEVGNPVPINIAEVLQSEYMDLVINIADSTGSLMEAEKLTEGLMHKCLIWLRGDLKGFQEGLARSLQYLGRPPLYFDTDDLQSCVISKASEDWVHFMRSRELELDILDERIQRSRVRRKGWVQ